MTKPETSDVSKKCIERGATKGVQSMRMYDAAREAIEETRRLLNDTSHYTTTQRGDQK